MGRHNSDRERIHEKPSDKKIRIRNLKKTIDFESFAKSTNLPLAYLENSCVNGRRKIRRRERQQIHVFLSPSEQAKNKMFVSIDRNTIYQGNEEKILAQYAALGGNFTLDEVKEILATFLKLTPGSGKAHQVIREVGERFFMTSESKIDMMPSQIGIHTPKIS